MNPEQADSDNVRTPGGATVTGACTAGDSTTIKHDSHIDVSLCLNHVVWRAHTGAQVESCKQAASLENLSFGVLNRFY